MTRGIQGLSRLTPSYNPCVDWSFSCTKTVLSFFPFIGPVVICYECYKGERKVEVLDERTHSLINAEAAISPSSIEDELRKSPEYDEEQPFREEDRASKRKEQLAMLCVAGMVSTLVTLALLKEYAFQ